MVFESIGFLFLVFFERLTYTLPYLKPHVPSFVTNFLDGRHSSHRKSGQRRFVLVIFGLEDLQLSSGQQEPPSLPGFGPRVPHLIQIT